MATRSQVEAAIAAIEDNGNNTALEVRHVLTQLLNYTENEQTTPSNLEPFHFFNDAPIEDNKTGSSLQFSCRGFKNEFANFTFKLRISINSKSNIFIFPLAENHGEEFFNILKPILPTDNMSFPIPFKIGQIKKNEIHHICVPTTISFKQVTITTGSSQIKTPVIQFEFHFLTALKMIELTKATLFDNLEAYTSICFHSNTTIK